MVFIIFSVCNTFCFLWPLSQLHGSLGCWLSVFKSWGEKYSSRLQLVTVYIPVLSFCHSVTFQSKRNALGLLKE